MYKWDYQKKTKKEPSKSPQVLVVNTFMMLGANYQSTELCGKICSKDDLMKYVMKKKPFAYGTYCFDKIPYYCENITLKKSKDVDLHGFWDLPGTYILFINAVKKQQNLQVPKKNDKK